MTPQQIAAAVLAKAGGYDQTMAKPDPVILAAWAESLDGIDRAAAMRAVTAHYSEEHRRIMPSDVLKRVRAESARQRTADLVMSFNAVPDADPDDVPAYLEALRAGRLVDNSRQAQERPIGELVTAVLAKGKNRIPVNDEASA